jgi:hypothetical protein
MSILIEFLLRAAFGLAMAMAITPPRKVTSGFYRNHLYVILGMCVLASLAALSLPTGQRSWLPLLAAGLSYAGAVAWLYEKKRAGVVLLLLVAAVSLAGDWQVARRTGESSEPAVHLLQYHLLQYVDAPTAGLLLGSVLGAMFLGHWYLNTPTMELVPLRRLLLLVAIATVARAIVCGAGLVLEIQNGAAPPLAFVALRWLAGLIGVGALAVMTWQTLKIPNTQSATGILYVAVIGVFIGELTSQLLSAHASFPLC